MTPTRRDSVDDSRAEAREEPLLRIDGVSKRFGNVTAVDDVSLTVGRGEFFALLGPSGCGKTTLLRMLAGFETPDAGRIVLDGVDVTATLPHRRPVNMMFQSYALFPHLDVAGNVAFGLKRAGLPRAETDARVAEMLALVRLGGFERRRPDQLSGGQRQRVALARALALRPKLLLLDEPLAALDKRLREETQAELAALQRRLGTSFVIVTHDQDEAMTLADRIGVMNAGKLVQVAAPRELYEQPASRWVAGFVGDVNLIEGRVAAVDAGIATLTTLAGDFSIAAPSVAVGQDIALAVRPEKVRIGAAATLANARDGVVTAVSYRGGASHLTIALDQGDLVLRAAIANASRSAAPHAIGARVMASFAPDDAVAVST